VAYSALTETWGWGMTIRRRLSARLKVLSLLVVMTWLASIVPGQAQTPADPVASVSPDENDGINDAADAQYPELAEATESGDSVIIDDLTSATTEVQANPDGTMTARIASGPVRVPDASSASGWSPIDTTLEATAEGIQPLATVADISFSDGGTEDTATLDLGADSFGLDLPGSLPEPTLEGDTATYSDAVGEVDLSLRATPTGFEQSFVLNEAPSAPLTFRLPFDLDGLTASVDADGNLALTDAQGQPVVEADAALMWDSSYDPHLGGPTHTAQVDARIVMSATGPTLELRPDPAFLADPELVYPVVVDPTTDLSVTKDTYVELLYPTQTYSTDNELKVGAIDSGGQTQKARTFLKFTTGPIDGKQILNAKLWLFENHSWSCTPKTVDVYRLNSGWSGPTWNNQPDYGLIYASKSFAQGYSASCPNAWVNISTGGGDGRDLQQLVQGWANGNIANEGLAIRAGSESDLTSWKKFNSSDHASNQPYLEVTYNSYPKVPTDIGATDTSPVSLMAEFSDPDGGNGRALFTIYDYLDQAVVTNVQGSLVASGNMSAYPIPSGLLEPGLPYTWTAKAQDSSSSSAASEPGSITIGDAPESGEMFAQENGDIHSPYFQYNPWGCWARLDYPHSAHSESNIIHTYGWIFDCEYVPPVAKRIEIWLYRKTFWWGWQKLRYSKASCGPLDNCVKLVDGSTNVESTWGLQMRMIQRVPCNNGSTYHYMADAHAWMTYNGQTYIIGLRKWSPGYFDGVKERCES
jgi:hypothetical protein